LTEENRDKRLEIWEKSYQSLKFIKNAHIIVVDNALPTRSLTNTQYEYFNANNKWFDVVAHYVALQRAKSLRHKYFAYMYDDFIVYDGSFVEDAVAYMDKNSDVSCIRIAEYNASDVKRYDSLITPKCINPESVSHVGVRGQNVIHRNKQIVGNHTFYKSNFRPISRPTLWRTSDFERIIGYPNPCQVMQSFEKHMYDCVDKDLTYVSGFIDGGVCHTFPQETSTRIKAGNNFGAVDLHTLRDKIDNYICVKNT
jgi:hypothetical protein